MLPRLSLALFAVVLTVNAAAQQAPIPAADNTAHGIYGVWTNLSTKTQAAVHAEAAASALNSTSTVTIASVTHWSGSFKYAPTGQVYPYTMIGTHPFNNPVSTTIPVAMIPLRFVFDDYLVNGQPLVFDPAATVTKLKASPIFVNYNYGFGSAQYMDALQRDSFSRTNGYHTLLGTPRMVPTVTIHVNSSNGTVYKTSYGYVGIINVGFLDSYTTTLPSKYGKVNELTIMVSSCIYASAAQSGYYYMGFHGDIQDASTSNPVNVRVWTWASWVGRGWFGNPNTLDIVPFTHEVAEAANDPFLSNEAPTYGYPYDLSSCNSILEVGDITEGLYNDSKVVTVSQYHYHVANVAMIPWFSRTAATTTTKSYSFPDTTVLTTPAQNCN
jgi:hypothetical protein